MDSQPPGRRKCSTVPCCRHPLELSAACSFRRRSSARRYRAQRRRRSSLLRLHGAARTTAGCGRCAAPVRRIRTMVRRPSRAAAPGSRRGPSPRRRSGRRRGPATRRRAGRRPRAGRVPHPGRGRPSRAARASAGSRPGPGGCRGRRRARVTSPLLSSQRLPSCMLPSIVLRRQAVAGGVPDDVVVGEHPGGRGSRAAAPRSGCR